jgi:hypothetical protein
MATWPVSPMGAADGDSGSATLLDENAAIGRHESALSEAKRIFN